ncbi:MAG: hypothetical protein K2J85_04520, partial [Anaeroplasmataceae bacterium]|nr:hypothetical protein [Anaeroplasmataceae bacterium]
MMKIIKRSGTEVKFDIKKITEAIRKANSEVMEKEQLSDETILELSNNVVKACKKAKYALG